MLGFPQDANYSIGDQHDNYSTGGMLGTSPNANYSTGEMVGFTQDANYSIGGML